MIKITGPFPGRVAKGLQGLTIGTKITLYYLGLLIFSIVVSSILYYRINSNIMSRKVSAVSFQTLGSISANIDALIDNVNNYSKMILSDAVIQDSLKSGRFNNLESQRDARRYLIRILEATPLLSAVYLFDNYGNKYGIDKLTIKQLRLRNIREADWYDEVIRRKGGYILKLNAGDIFADTLSKEPYLSHIRVVNDLDTQKPIGILIIHISQKALVGSITGVDNKYLTSIILKDENNQDITRVNNLNSIDIGRFTGPPQKGFHSLTQRIKNKWYLISRLKTGRGWNIISIMPFDELSRESRIFSMIAFALILMNGLLMFCGLLLISMLITVPINKLLKSMRDVKNGRFEMVEITAGDDEIGKLRDGYNVMILEIKKLLDRTIEEQKIIRKAELDILQEQIKPHFLYNTFDAISALALAGRSNDVYTVMKALGSYYRMSLSKGSQVITVAEEIEIVKNYLTIQKIRYGDIFDVDYQVDEESGSQKVLKLILQPLVENSLYHGIKPKGEKGLITVKARYTPEFIELTVADDGMGIPAAKVEAIMNESRTAPPSSFGLRGTIERLRIFYGIEDILRIESKEGAGTRIIITIPAVKMEF